MSVLKEKRKGRRVLQVEGMVMCRRMEAERSKLCVGDDKISMPVPASLYMGVTKESG